MIFNDQGSRHNRFTSNRVDLGDVRVLFDYFFPGILTSYGGSAISIPSALIAAWPSLQTPITNAINPIRLRKVVARSRPRVMIGCVSR